MMTRKKKEKKVGAIKHPDKETEASQYISRDA